mmetsp:Transcript_85287/g.231481  ORF Transcript_85287/g.231481 Transcript_85287/m.231481 type:complete len:241 (-) Transcript_85287:91-813(-)
MPPRCSSEGGPVCTHRSPRRAAHKRNRPPSGRRRALSLPATLRPSNSASATFCVGALPPEAQPSSGPTTPASPAHWPASVSPNAAASSWPASTPSSVLFAPRTFSSWLLDPRTARPCSAALLPAQRPAQKHICLWLRPAPASPLPCASMLRALASGIAPVVAIAMPQTSPTKQWPPGSPSSARHACPATTGTERGSIAAFSGRPTYFSLATRWPLHGSERYGSRRPRANSHAPSASTARG